MPEKSGQHRSRIFSLPLLPPQEQRRVRGIRSAGAPVPSVGIRGRLVGRDGEMGRDTGPGPIPTFSMGTAQVMVEKEASKTSRTVPVLLGKMQGDTGTLLDHWVGCEPSQETRKNVFNHGQLGCSGFSSWATLDDAKKKPIERF